MNTSDKITRTIVYIIAILAIVAAGLSCTKEVPLVVEKKLSISDFDNLLTQDRIYEITSMTDTLGNTVPFDTATDVDNRYVFIEADSLYNGRVFNTTTQTVCFVHWSAYPHPYGWIAFQWVDFDLTETYYRLLDYSLAEGWFKVQSGNIVITYKREL